MSMLLTGVGNVIGPEPLDDGWWQFDGDASNMPLVEGVGWVAWDGSTNVQWTGLTGSIGYRGAAGLEPTTWETDISWNGAISVVYTKGDAGGMSPMTDTDPTTGSHVVFTSGTEVGTFTGEGSDPDHRAVYTATNAGALLLEGSTIA